LKYAVPEDFLIQRVTEEHDKLNNLKFIKEVSDSTPLMLGFHREAIPEIIPEILDLVNTNGYD